jgi:hypothetical protein
MKTGDKIYLAIGDRISFCEVVGFRSYCTELKSGDMQIITARYSQGLFYGFGYDSGQRCLFLTKLWHYYFAVMIEKIRLAMPAKWAKRLKLER